MPRWVPAAAIGGVVVIVAIIAFAMTRPESGPDVTQQNSDQVSGTEDSDLSDVGQTDVDRSRPPTQSNASSSVRNNPQSATVTQNSRPTTMARPSWSYRSTFAGPPGCPVFLADGNIVSSVAGRPVGRLQQPIELNAKVYLSPDGRFAAAARKNLPSDVTVWNLSDGSVAFTIPASTAQIVDFVALTKSHLFFGGRGAPQIQMWELVSGKRQQDITLPIDRVYEYKVAVSQDGATISTFSRSPSFLNLETGKSTPLAAPPDQPLLPGTPATSGRSPAFNASGLSPHSFSADGTEIAVAHSDRIVCWNTQGEITFDSHIYGGWFNPSENLCWLSNAGWLIKDLIVDRESKLPIVRIGPGQTRDYQPRILDDDRLMAGLSATTEAPFGDVGIIEIPFRRLRETLSELKTGNVYLKPGMTVTFETDFSNIPATNEWVQNETAQWANRMQANGFRVQPGQSNVFRYRYARPSENPQPVRSERLTSNGGPLRKDETNVVVPVMELLVNGEAVWRSLGRAVPVESFRFYMKDNTATRLVSQAPNFTLPIIVPKSVDNPALPATVN